MAGDFQNMSTLTLENPHLRVDVLSGVGPRIVRLIPAATGKNLLADAPGATWDHAYGTYRLIGGHRLWHAPEATPRTYIPDDEGLDVDEIPQGFALQGKVEPGTGIRKHMDVTLSPDSPSLTVCHRLENHGLWPVRLAPWAITALAFGGIAVLPQPVGPADPDGLLANRRLVLWPYTRWADPRLHVADDLICVEGRELTPPCKVGTFAPQGWLAYLRDGVLFVKHVDVEPEADYPDMGCNAEVYSGDQFIEVESLGPLTVLDPGGAVTYEERWTIHTGLDVAATPEGAREAVEQVGL